MGVCRFPVCVCRAIQCRAVSFLVSTSGEMGRGRGVGEITCRLLAWLQSPIVNQGIPEGGIGEERGEREREAVQ